MARSDSLTAKKFMDEHPVTVDKSDSLGSIKDKMEEEEIVAVPVVEDGKFAGVISYRELIRFLQFNPGRAKPEKVMHQPPEFEVDSNVRELAELRINSGRKMLVKTQGNKLKAVFGQREFLEAVTNCDEFENFNTARISTNDLETVYIDTTFEEARHLMLDKNISRLPVVDRNGKLEGIIRSTDLLSGMITRESIDSGGTAGDRHGTIEVNIAGGIEKRELSEVTVEHFINYDVLTSKESLKASEAAEKMFEEEKTEMVFVDDNYPESILTVKDFLQHLADNAFDQAVMVNITGLEVDEEKAAVFDKVKQQLQGSLGRKLERPEELSLVVKKADKDGKKHRYEVDLKLFSEYGVTTINEEAWDLLEVVDEALTELDKVVRKEKESRDDRRKSGL